MTIGEVLDYLYGYEVREANANNRARCIMAAFIGEDPQKIWPLFTDTREEPQISETPQEALKRFASLMGAV